MLFAHRFGIHVNAALHTAQGGMCPGYSMSKAQLNVSGHLLVAFMHSLHCFGPIAAGWHVSHRLRVQGAAEPGSRSSIILAAGTALPVIFMYVPHVLQGGMCPTYCVYYHHHVTM
jgi:hypothetical protein